MIEKIFVTSTAHLPKREMDLLNRHIRDDSYNGWVRHEGAMVSVDTFIADESLEDFAHLKALLNYAKNEDCTWLMLDCDAETMPFHPTFDW